MYFFCDFLYLLFTFFHFFPDEDGEEFQVKMNNIIVLEMMMMMKKTHLKKNEANITILIKLLF